MSGLPKITDPLVWQQAELLMQPVFIRILDNIRKNLEDSPIQAEYQEVSEPHPQYLMHLTHGEQNLSIDLWLLCYQVCFVDYQPGQASVTVDVDLIDPDGDVAWEHLDAKAKTFVDQVFAQLTT